LLGFGDIGHLESSFIATPLEIASEIYIIDIWMQIIA
jgi:hypothetical protein